MRGSLARIKQVSCFVVRERKNMATTTLFVEILVVGTIAEIWIALILLANLLKIQFNRGHPVRGSTQGKPEMASRRTVKYGHTGSRRS